MTRRIVRFPAAGTALVLILATSPSLAHDADLATLEARVAELELKLAQLLDEKEPVSAPDGGAEPAIKRLENTYAFGGYIKFDAMFSDHSNGDLAPGSAGTQFYIPWTIPVGGLASERPSADLQGRESRINFKSSHSLANGDELSTFIEMDFLLSPGGNERVSNSYNPRLRQAYFKYNNWLFGQAWSTFQDVEALPENLDFVGPAESTTFVRQPQIRYTKGAWEFAVENPETTVTPYGGGATIVADDGGIPDFTTRYTAQLADGYVKAALLFRQLTYETVDDDETGFGLSLSGKHFFGEDDLRWMATIGRGTGRYLGLNTANGAVLDGNGNLEAIDQWGAFVSYRHIWSGRWRSNFTYGYLSNNHDTALTGVNVTKDVRSIHVNLLYAPTPKMTVGGELMFAERTLENSVSGDMKRLLLSAKYAF